MIPPVSMPSTADFVHTLANVIHDVFPQVITKRRLLGWFAELEKGFRDQEQKALDQARELSEQSIKKP